MKCRLYAVVITWLLIKIKLEKPETRPTTVRAIWQSATGRQHRESSFISDLRRYQINMKDPIGLNKDKSRQTVHIKKEEEAI